MKITLIACVLSGLALVACKGNDAPKSEVAPKAAPLSAEETKIANWKTLALADAHGDTQIDQRIMTLQFVVQKNPKKMDPWVKLGQAWVEKARVTADPGFYLQADACADIALTIEENSKQAIGLKSLVALNQHKFAEAKTLAEQVLQIDPRDPMAYGSLADAAFELGDLDLAAQSAQQMMQIKPNLPSYSRVALLAWYFGRTADAKRVSALAIDAGRDPKDPEPGCWQLVQTAMYFWHEGDYEGASAGADQALQLFHDYPPALVLKARISLAQNDPKHAQTLLATAHKKSPLVETAWLLADAAELAGDAEAAKQAREMAERDGKKTDNLTLSRFWSNRNEHAEEALELVKEELKTRGGVAAKDAYAWALYRTGRIAEAKAAILEARKFGTPDARLLYHEGAIRMAAGEDKEGRALVQKALSQNPMFDVHAVPEARALLAQSRSKS